MKGITKADLKEIEPIFAFIDWRPEEQDPASDETAPPARIADASAESRVQPKYVAP